MYLPCWPSNEPMISDLNVKICAKLNSGAYGPNSTIILMVNFWGVWSDVQPSPLQELFLRPMISPSAGNSYPGTAAPGHEEIFIISLQSSAVQCSAVQCSAMQCSAVQCSAVQCSAVQCNAVQCSALQCSAVQYIIINHILVQYSALDCSLV